MNTDTDERDKKPTNCWNSLRFILLIARKKLRYFPPL